MADLVRDREHRIAAHELGEAGIDVLGVILRERDVVPGELEPDPAGTVHPESRAEEKRRNRDPGHDQSEHLRQRYSGDPAARDPEHCSAQCEHDRGNDQKWFWNAEQHTDRRQEP